MEELLKQIIEVLKGNSTVTIITIIISGLSALGAVISAIISLVIVKINIDSLKETKRGQIIANQQLYPFMSFKLEQKDINYRGITPPKDISISTIESTEYSGNLIRINNGILATDKKPVLHFIFQLINNSKAVIKRVALKEFSVIKPIKLEGKTLTVEESYFSNLNDELSGTYLIENSNFTNCLLLFLDSEQYVKYFQSDTIGFTFVIEIEIITGLKFYQQIIFDGGSVSYNWAECYDELKIDRMRTSNIDIY